MCLEIFCKSSGQRVSEQKTRMFFSQNLNHNKVSQTIETLGFQLTNDVGQYLGMPLIHKRTSKFTYKEIVDRIQKRISSWNAKTLAFAERLTLAKSVLTSILLYSMQTVILPSSIYSEMDKSIRNFLRGVRF